MLHNKIDLEILCVSPEASQSALGQSYLLIAVICMKLDHVGCILSLPCSSAEINAVGEAGDEMGRVMISRKKLKRNR